MLLARANAFRLSAVVGESDGVISVSASACHNSGPKGVSSGQKALLHGTNLVGKKWAMEVNGVAGYGQHLNAALSIEVVDADFTQDRQSDGLLAEIQLPWLKADRKL